MRTPTPPRRGGAGRRHRADTRSSPLLRRGRRGCRRRGASCSNPIQRATSCTGPPLLGGSGENPKFPPEEAPLHDIQSGKNRSIRGPQGRTRHLSAQDANFVAEHDDLDGQVLLPTTGETEQLEETDEGKVGE